MCSSHDMNSHHWRADARVTTLTGFDRRVLERQEEEEREREERLREKRDRRVRGPQLVARGLCIYQDVAIVCHVNLKPYRYLVLQKAKAASDDEEEEFDPEMAAAMGFGGFGSSKQ